MWTVHYCKNMVVFRNFSSTNHHEKWPSSKNNHHQQQSLISQLYTMGCKRMLGSKTFNAKCEFFSELYNIYRVWNLSWQLIMHNLIEWLESLFVANFPHLQYSFAIKKLGDLCIDVPIGFSGKEKFSKNLKDEGAETLVCMPY